MALPRSAANIIVQIIGIEVGINEPGNILENGNWNLADENEASQALICFEQHEEAHLSDIAFGRMQRQKPFRRSGGIDRPDLSWSDFA